jgi:hypothetical protein
MQDVKPPDGSLPANTPHGEASHPRSGPTARFQLAGVGFAWTRQSPNRIWRKGQFDSVRKWEKQIRSRACGREIAQVLRASEQASLKNSGANTRRRQEMRVGKHKNRGKSLANVRYANIHILI